jgi:hypothetical protein
MMQFCMDHWNMLREALKERGLYALVPDNSEKAIDNLQREMTGERSVDTFDPLMNAHWAIIGNLMDQFGLAVMGEGCPLCLANEAHDTQCHDPNCSGPKPFDKYIEYAADEQVAAWKGLNQ